MFKYLFFVLFISNLTFGQVFIPLDIDTDEFIEDVNYTLYKDNRKVYNGITLNDKPTKIYETEYDSITFSRVDYIPLTLGRINIDSIIYLKKHIIYLDEVVIETDKDKIITLGETNRFINRKNSYLTRNLIQGLVFVDAFPEVLQLDKIAFYVEKVKVKTAYQINVLNVKEKTVSGGHQILEFGDALYKSDTLYLNPKDNSKIEVALPPGWELQPGKPVFVWIQLLNYYDEDGNVAEPLAEDKTRLRFQLSDTVNYYGRMVDLYTNELSKDLINYNLMAGYDFANDSSLGTPSKSVFAAPAILLFAHKASPLNIRQTDSAVPK